MTPLEPEHVAVPASRWITQPFTGLLCRCGRCVSLQPLESSEHVSARPRMGVSQLCTCCDVSGCRSLSMSRRLSWMSESSCLACAWPGPCSTVCEKTSSCPPLSSAASISSCEIEGCTILYCRAIRSRCLDLNLACTSWYSAIDSTNLRLSVACMLVRMRASLAPGFFFAKSLFAASIALSCARTFLASTFMPPDFSCSSFAAALPCSALVAVRDSL
mmetsp:Transcript_44492/g.148439  ORF Transcript_44492/g.148439 Transcript_44492/m.148439 type:complete len:217 (-) Transcript_44492:206-856(-)